MQDLRSLIEGVNSEEEKRAAENYRFMEEQKIKKALAPALWEELKAKMQDYCESFKKSSPVNLSMSAEGVYELSVTNIKNARTLSLAYNRDVPCVFYKGPSATGRLVFRVSPDGNCVNFMLGEIPKSLDALIVFLIQPLIA